MPETIRLLEEKDFDSISKLYNGRKTISELKWLFKDPEDPTRYNGFVALNNENKIIGTIGYALSNYTDGVKTLSGVIPMSWKIAEDYKGLAGVQLFKKVLSLGTFGLAISGSEKAQQLYPLFKYKFVSNIKEYYKILDLSDSFLSIKKKSFFKKIGFFVVLIPSYFKKNDKTQYSITFTRYSGTNFREDSSSSTAFRKLISKKYIDWLLECPTLESFAFTIEKGNQNLGTCVLYINKVNHRNHGRIVHLPHLGNDLGLWNAVIIKCISFLTEKKCSIISVLAHQSEMNVAIMNAGFIEPKGYIKPVFIKDQTGVLENLDFTKWHIQYTEGDKAYRNF